MHCVPVPHHRKCILLFTISLCSSVFATVMNDNLNTDWTELLLHLDLMCNGVCLYLQFADAKTLYMRCCKYPDSFCRWFMTFRIKRWQKRNKNQQRNQNNFSKSNAATAAGAGACCFCLTQMHEIDEI